MISNLFKSLRLTIAFCLFFSVFYIFVLWLFAQVAGPNKGNAELVTLNGKVVGAANVGQNFTQDIYFWGRPSHAGDKPVAVAQRPWLRHNTIYLPLSWTAKRAGDAYCVA